MMTANSVIIVVIVDNAVPILITAVVVVRFLSVAVDVCYSLSPSSSSCPSSSSLPHYSGLGSWFLYMDPGARDRPGTDWRARELGGAR